MVYLRVYLCSLALTSSHDFGNWYFTQRYSPSQPVSVHVMDSGWLCTWSFRFLFLFWVCCCQKWQIWQNGDIFNLLVAMPSGRTYYVFWEIGTLRTQNKVKEEWIIDEMLFDFLTNSKSRAADYKISSTCLMRAALAPPGWYWDLILCSQGSAKTSFFGLDSAHSSCELFQ